MIRVLVLANSAVVRAGLQAMLREDLRFDPVAGDFPITQLQRMAFEKPAPDVVLAEIAGKRLSSLSPAPDSAESIPLVLLIDDVNRSELLRAIHMGARAVLSRTARPAEIFAAIEAAAAGLTAFGPDELDLLLPATNGVEPEDEIALEALSGREIEVLALMAQGLPNKSIANRLNISEHTAKFHVSSILSKLGASSRTDAVTRGLKAGLLVI
jgi:two-component system, NarL family, response regulator YdfI